jgi:acetolactate synthase-1/3 small subunit
MVGLGTIFGAKVASVAPSSITFEMMGTRSIINDFINMIKPYGIKEIVRSGTIAIGQSRK